MKEVSFPLQQGDLDWLCSVYAVINLLHVRSEIHSIEGAVGAFEGLLGSFVTPKTARLLITEGAEPDYVLKMIDYVLKMMKSRDLDAKLIDAPCREDVMSHAERGAIIYFEIVGQEFDHYTVVLKRTELELADSYGFRRIHYGDGWLIDEHKVEILALLA